MNFVKLTKKNGDSEWINLDLIIIIDADMAGAGMSKGSRLFEVGEDSALYIVRETPEEILAMVSKPQYIVDTRGLELPDIKPGSVRAFEGK
ncbi:hypothetical protein LCGC14_2789650 [marine sediment metagenome]|uniref:Uncharacterized protein n=1 Tax=marine sediment metagenome TaxID=412755 RepID=A0A0F9AZJ1_9ZZZZ